MCARAHTHVCQSTSAAPLWHHSENNNRDAVKQVNVCIRHDCNLNNSKLKCRVKNHTINHTQKRKFSSLRHW